MTLAANELYCLNCTTDDYEDLSSICSQLSQTLSNPPQESEIASIISKLLTLNLVSAYRLYDGKWSILNSNIDLHQDWFLITEDGRKVLESECNEES